jgi:hypothetical protein
MGASSEASLTRESSPATDGPVGRHGLRSTYVNTRCRCDECKKANRDYDNQARKRNVRYRARLAEKTGTADSTIIHGIAQSYKWHGCRCEECVEAVRIYWREYKRYQKFQREQQQ